MEQRVPIPISDFIGLYSRVSELDLPPGASPVFRNIELLKRGWVVRPGYDNVNTSSPGANPITGIFDGFNHILVSTSDKVYKINGSGLDELKTGLTSNAIPSFCSYNALDIMVNGSGNNNPQSWDGSTWQDLAGSPPKADHCVVWRNRVFLTGLASPAQCEVQLCRLETPTVWEGEFLRSSKREKGANLICSQVVPFQGEEDGTRLAVFASDRIYHFDGYSKNTWTIYVVQPNIGSISKRGHCSADGIHFWVDDGGIFATPDGGYSVNQISWSIQPTFAAIAKSSLASACAAHDRERKQIWWSFNTPQTQQTTVLIYCYGMSTPMAGPQTEGARHVWLEYVLPFCTVAEIFDSVASKYKIYGGEAWGTGTGGFVYEVGALQSDNGASKTVTYETAWLKPDPGSSSMQSILRKLVCWYDSAVANASPIVHLFLDGNDVAVATSTLSLTTGTRLLTADADFNHIAETFKFRIVFSPTTENFRLLKLIPEFRPLRGAV